MTVPRDARDSHLSSPAGLPVGQDPGPGSQIIMPTADTPMYSVPQTAAALPSAQPVLTNSLLKELCAQQPPQQPGGGTGQTEQETNVGSSLSGDKEYYRHSKTKGLEIQPLLLSSSSLLLSPLGLQRVSGAPPPSTPPPPPLCLKRTRSTGSLKARSDTGLLQPSCLVSDLQNRKI